MTGASKCLTAPSGNRMSGISASFLWRVRPGAHAQARTGPGKTKSAAEPHFSSKAGRVVRTASASDTASVLQPSSTRSRCHNHAFPDCSALFRGSRPRPAHVEGAIGLAPEPSCGLYPDGAGLATIRPSASDRRGRRARPAVTRASCLGASSLIGVKKRLQRHSGDSRRTNTCTSAASAGRSWRIASRLSMALVQDRRERGADALELRRGDQGAEGLLEALVLDARDDVLPAVGVRNMAPIASRARSKTRPATRAK